MAGVHGNSHAVASERLRHHPIATRRIGPHIGGQMHAPGANLGRELWDHRLGSPRAQNEPTSALAERVRQVLQALEQELGSRSGGVAPAEQSVVEAEDRDDPLARLKRSGERRVIVHAQVAPQPYERGHPSSCVTAAWR
jgi:hypothetical protein